MLSNPDANLPLADPARGGADTAGCSNSRPVATSAVDARLSSASDTSPRATTLLIETVTELPSEVLQPPKSAARHRVYYLDWMRIVSIYLVVWYHVVQALDWAGLWCGYQQQQATSFRCVALQIGMPMFFHISGRAQALSRVMRLRQTAIRRFVRLILPFVICYVLLVPTWMWVHLRENLATCVVDEGDACAGSGLDPHALADKCYRTESNTNPDVAQNLIVFLFRYWTTKEWLERFDPAWLWFLPILYLATVSSTPLILWGETKSTRYILVMVVWWLLQSWIVLAILVNGYNASFVFFLGLPSFGTALLVKTVPFPSREVEGEPATQLARFLAIRACTLLHVVATVGLVLNFRYAGIDNHVGFSAHPLRAVPQMFMYPLFYMQGYYAARWWPEGTTGTSSKKFSPPPRKVRESIASGGIGLEASHNIIQARMATFNGGTAAQVRPSDREADEVLAEDTIWDVRICVKFYKLVAICLMFLTIFAGCPVGDWEFSSWPVYSASFHDDNDFFAVGYVVSTWAWIGIADAIFQSYMEDVVHPRIHQHASASTIVVYIFHWAFIKPYVWFVIRNFGLMYDHWKYVAVASTFAVGAGGSIFVYWLLLRYPSVGWLFGL